MSLLPMNNGIGMPTGMPGQPNQMEGLLGNPYLQMGLGILANNTGNYGQLGPALGRGMSQGLQTVQHSKQFDQQHKLYQLKLKEAEREQKQYDDQQEAIRQATEKNPELGYLFKIDPKAAIKAVNPSLNTADPYFSDRYIGGKVYSYNHRTGEYQEKNLGGSTLPNKDDPFIQGNVAGAKEQAKAAWTPNTDIDGVLTTDERVVRDVYGNSPIPFSGLPTGLPPQGVAPQSPVPQPQAQPQPNLPTNNFSTPYPVTFGAPGTTATDRAEGVTGPNAINVGNPARPNVGGGIRVPTAAEKAAEKTAAEEQAKFNSPEAQAKRAKAQEFKLTAGKVVVDTIDDVLKRVDNWTAGFGGSVLDSVPGTDAYNLKSDLETIKANFGFDRLQAMRDMSPTGGALGQVAVQELSALQASVANLDNAQSPAQLKANLNKAKQHYDNWLKTLEEDPNKKQIIQSGKAGGMVGTNQSQAKPNRSKQDILKQYGVK